MKPRPPTITEKEYRQELLKILDFDHKCYELILSADNEYSLQNSFLFEIKKRYFFITNYFDNENINGHKCLFSDDNLKDVKSCIKTAKNYFEYLSKNTEYFFTEYKHISLKKLLVNHDFNDYNLTSLENAINHFFIFPESIENLDDCKFFEYYSKGNIFGDQEGYDNYEKIKNELYEYIIKDDFSELKEICKKYFGKNYNENKVYLHQEFIYRYINQYILNDLKITIKYLRDANLYEKYIDVLKEAYDKYIRVKEVKTISDEIALNKYDIINNNVSIKLDFSLPLNYLIKHIEHIYTYVNNSEFEDDYKLLFGQNQVIKKYNPFEQVGNQSNITKYFNELFENKDVSKDKKKFIILKNNLVANLLNFDALFLCATYENIDDILRKKFEDTLILKYLSKKEEKFEYIFNLIRSFEPR